MVITCTQEFGELHCNLFAVVDSCKIGSNHQHGHFPSKISLVYLMFFKMRWYHQLQSYG